MSMNQPQTKSPKGSIAVPPHAVGGEVGHPPHRVQLSRRKGSRLPTNTVVVARPSRWGNPFIVTESYPVERAVTDYEAWLTTDPKGMEVLRAAQVELRGKNLGCWCKPGTACHGDVLLRLVNT
jgi:hypothetical protein